MCLIHNQKTGIFEICILILTVPRNFIGKTFLGRRLSCNLPDLCKPKLTFIFSNLTHKLSSNLHSKKGTIYQMLKVSLSKIVVLHLILMVSLKF